MTKQSKRAGASGGATARRRGSHSKGGGGRANGVGGGGGGGEAEADPDYPSAAVLESWQSLHAWLKGERVAGAEGGEGDAEGEGGPPLPAAISQTWHGINRQLLASRMAAAQRFHASRARVEALRHSLTKRRLQYMAERKKRKDAERAARLVVGLGSHEDTLNFTVGAALYGVMHFVAGAAPGLLPALNCLFFTFMMLFRTAYFVRRKWTFFLIDFCYWANIATVLHLMLFPQEDHFSAVVFAMNEGPLSGALVVWRFGWLFGSREHTFSTLMHLLPGLAVHCHRYYLGPKGWEPLLQTSKALLTGSEHPDASWSRYVISDRGLGWRWHMAAPLAFYCAWQLGYYIVVQVLFRRFIKRNGYETSYTVLSNRVMRNEKGPWKRLMGGYPHSAKIVIFGLTQLLFTIVTMFMAWPMFYSYRLSLSWQLVKVVVSLYYGGKMQCQVLPEKLGSRKIEHYISQLAADGTPMPHHTITPLSPGSFTSPPPNKDSAPAAVTAVQHESRNGAASPLSPLPKGPKPQQEGALEPLLKGDPEDVEDDDDEEEEVEEEPGAEQNKEGQREQPPHGVQEQKEQAPRASVSGAELQPRRSLSSKGVNGLGATPASVKSEAANPGEELYVN